MKLDRNINTDGSGKYALVKMRSLNVSSDGDVHNAFRLLVENGLIHFGNEGPGEQFFVMKYKDMFTVSGLEGYATAVILEAGKVENEHNFSKNDPAVESLQEYADEIFKEAREAQRHGTRIPD